jgi:hypothetical protein
MPSFNPPSTRRLKKSDEDRRMMQVKDDIARITKELQALPVNDPQRAVLQASLIPLRKELMASLGATKKL